MRTEHVRWLTLDATGLYLEEWNGRLGPLGLRRLDSGMAQSPFGRRRAIHVPQSIIDMFEGRRMTGFPDFRANRLAAIFVAGQFVTVSLIGRSKKRGGLIWSA